MRVLGFVDAFARSLATLVIGVGIVNTAFAQETTHLSFVQEYIRELGELESVRTSADAELKHKDGRSPGNLIHISTRYQLALRTDVGILNKMRLDPPFESLVRQISDFDKQKIEIHARMIEIATEMLSGPKPDVDYGKMAAEMPQLRAVLESIDETFMKMSALVFATLIDKRPDKANHMSRLIITKAERQALIGSLNTWFGTKLDQKDQNYIVSAASVLRSYLRKHYTCADGP
ncbi:MAG: hypothetical protein ACRD5Z_02860 [Bryobacteraceae bacterium]